MVAPSREMSAVSHALTISQPLRFEHVGQRMFSVEGTPADCVNLAVSKLLPKPPDVVVSGINRGPNVGDDLAYSGTVAGAREALSADDVGFVEAGVPHALSAGADGARCYELHAPQPGAQGMDDTVFLAGSGRVEPPEHAFRRGRFDEAALPPPSSAIGLEGFGQANVGAASLQLPFEATDDRYVLGATAVARGELELKASAHEGAFRRGELVHQVERSQHALAGPELACVGQRRRADVSDS